MCFKHSTGERASLEKFPVKETCQRVITAACHEIPETTEVIDVPIVGAWDSQTNSDVR